MKPRRRNRWAPAAALAACLAVLAACTSTTSLPVSRREARAAVHVVQPGETLTKIAWQHRVDMQELARWNGIDDPDRLRVGQRLRLVPPRGYVAPPPVETVRPPPTPARATTRPQSASQPRPNGATGSASRQTPPATRQTAPATRQSSPPRTASAPPSRGAAPRSPAAATPLAWSWPTEGPVVSGFGAADGGVTSGISIGGRAGQPVRAAAAGRVVYAGGGLIGYGQLVIVKHDDTFLSAYGYNAELLVTQGQEVARGATIALMGQGPGRRPLLHFEIRRNGVPVDPLLFVSPPR